MTGGEGDRRQRWAAPDVVPEVMPLRNETPDGPEIVIIAGDHEVTYPATPDMARLVFEKEEGRISEEVFKSELGQLLIDAGHESPWGS